MKPVTLHRLGLVAALAIATACVALGGPASAGSDDGDAPASSSQAGPSGPARIVVTGDRRQVIDGWGASVVTETVVDPIVRGRGLSRRRLAAMDRLVFRAAGINLIRVFSPGYTLGPLAEPGAPRIGDGRFAFMKRARRYGVRFMLTGARAPSSSRDGKGLAPGREGAYAGFLADIARFARNRVGVPFDYAAIANEPDNGASLLTLPPAQAAQVSRELARRLRSRGLSTRLVVGDNTGWAQTLVYARSAPGAGARVLASHAYGGAARDRRGLSRFAQRRRLPVWQTEWGTGCGGCGGNGSIANALDWSRQIAAALTEAGASAWFAFRPVASSDHGPGDGLIVRRYDRPDRPFAIPARFHAFRQYSSVARPGARRLAVRTSGGVYSVGFVRGRRRSVVITNPLERDVDATLSFGRRRGRLTARRTSAGEGFRGLRARRYAGEAARISLPGQSISSFTLSPRP